MIVSMVMTMTMTIMMMMVQFHSTTIIVQHIRHLKPRQGHLPETDLVTHHLKYRLGTGFQIE